MTVRRVATADASFANRRECGLSNVGITSRSNPAATTKLPIVHNKTRTICRTLRLGLSDGITGGPLTIERYCMAHLRGYHQNNNAKTRLRLRSDFGRLPAEFSTECTGILLTVEISRLHSLTTIVRPSMPEFPPRFERSKRDRPPRTLASQKRAEEHSDSLLGGIESLLHRR